MSLFIYTLFFFSQRKLLFSPFILLSFVFWLFLTSILM